MGLIKKLKKAGSTKGQSFSQSPLSDPYRSFWSSSSRPMNRETIENNFTAYIKNIYKDNGVAYACVQTRMLVFSEARLMLQKMEDGRPGDLEYDEMLKPLDNPWPGGDTGSLLATMEVDASLAGNSYHTYTDGAGNYGNAAKMSEDARIVRMRPDWVDIIIWSPNGSEVALNAKVLGYLYRPWGATQGENSVMLMADEVAHYAPIPDPDARYRGMSWLKPILRDIQGDSEAMKHKLSFFERGATLGHVVRMAETVGQEDFDMFVEKFKAVHEGWENAYGTLFLGGGADISTIGADLKQLDFSQTIGQGETRIAAASGVPPVIVGLSEGLQAATYSNYAQARRRFADGTLRPLWRMAAQSLGVLLDLPENTRLWYDDRDIAFLRDDRMDEAEIADKNAKAIKSMVEAGWEPDSVKEYMISHDPSVLEHTGMVSVQLMPPGTPLNPMNPGQQPANDRPPGGQPQQQQGQQGAGTAPGKTPGPGQRPASREK